MRDTSWYHPLARNHRRPLPAFTRQIEDEKNNRCSEHVAEKRAVMAQFFKIRGKTVTNLELPGP